jgi:hypothetical protein
MDLRLIGNFVYTCTSADSHTAALAPTTLHWSAAARHGLCLTPPTDIELVKMPGAAEYLGAYLEGSDNKGMPGRLEYNGKGGVGELRSRNATMQN